MADRSSHSPARASLDESPSSAHPANASKSNLHAADGRTSIDRLEGSKPNDDALTLYRDVLQSEIGVSILLERLKQSIGSMRDFAVFAKERGSIEEKHAAALARLSESSQAAAKRADARQGSYGRGYGQLSYLHKGMAEHGGRFGMSLSSMHTDLADLAADKERVRKQLKHDSGTAEKRAADAELAMEKARAKYHALAEEYDRARTGDRQGGRFGLKGPKSAAQVEEDLHRKMQNADADYAQKVQQAQGLRAELVNSQRPQHIQALEQHINEIDAALGLHMQSFAKLNETMLLANAMCVSPPKGQGGPPKQGFRDVVHQIDNAQDLRTFVLNHSAKTGPKHKDPQYEAHHTQAAKPMLQPQAGSQPSSMTNRQQMPPQQMPSQPIPQQMAHQQIHAPQPQYPSHSQQHLPPIVPPSQENLNQQPGGKFGRDPSPYAPDSPPHNTFQQPPSQPHGPPSGYPPGGAGYPPGAGQYPRAPSHDTSPEDYQAREPFYQQPPQQHSIYGQGSGSGPTPYDQPPKYGQHNASEPSSGNNTPPPANGGPIAAPAGSDVALRPAAAAAGPPPPAGGKPMFGIALEDLFVRDGVAVPSVIVQCLQAIELYGLEVEGIYRLSGSQTHVTKLRDAFNRGEQDIDFRNPEHFYHDVNDCAGLLKAFFKELPDPLLTHEHYDSFIEAAHIDDDITRRDSLHAVVNGLPDSHYATLRALTLHLHRVAEHEARNKMGTGNLAICLAPTLMVSHAVPNIADAGWQVRTVDSILQNALMIFDDD